MRVRKVVCHNINKKCISSAEKIKKNNGFVNF